MANKRNCLSSAKKAGKALKILGVGLLTTSGLAATIPIYHHIVTPRVHGIDQALITKAIEDSSEQVKKINPNNSENKDFLENVFYPGIMASYHSGGSNIAGHSGELVYRDGEAQIFQKTGLTHINKEEYENHTRILEKFWERFSLVESVQIDPKAVSIQGLRNSQTFTALAVRDNKNPEKIYVFVPGANRDDITGFSDLAEGVKVMLHYTNKGCGALADFLKRVEDKTNLKPNVVTYSNSSTLGLTAAVAGYNCFMLEGIGLNPSNLSSICDDAKKCFDADVTAAEAVKRINKNTVAIYYGSNAKIYGYTSAQLTNSFCFLSQNEKLNQDISNESWFIRSAPLSKSHQIAWLLKDVTTGNGKYQKLKRTPGTVLGVIRQNMDFNGSIVEGENSDSSVQLKNMDGSPSYPRRSSNRYPIDLTATGLAALGTLAVRQKRKQNSKGAKPS